MPNDKVMDLIDLLNLKQIEKNIFEGQNKDIGGPMVFGGQVLAQALNAAMRTVKTAVNVHSMHAYFILPGNIDLPIRYEVDCIRDGRSFVTRRIVAFQKNKAIFNMAASFHRFEEGYNHQIEMLNVPPPESLMSFTQYANEMANKFDLMLIKTFADNSPIDFRPVEQINLMNPGKKPPFRHVWFKADGTLPNDKNIHQCVAAYASDFNLLTTALLPHNVSMFQGKMQLASLDHAMWFHRDFKADEWLLYAIDSPSASNARGFCRGSIFSRNGQLVASVTQEGLMRLWNR